MSKLQLQVTTLMCDPPWGKLVPTVFMLATEYVTIAPKRARTGEYLYLKLNNFCCLKCQKIKTRWSLAECLNQQLTIR